MLATVRPGVNWYDESLSTLKYASRARTIVNTCVRSCGRADLCFCLAWLGRFGVFFVLFWFGVGVV